jgi:CRP/FNR family transcriptional regulator, cyclic AMP receptor protein
VRTLPRDLIRLLDADPDLGDQLAPDEFERANQELLARGLPVPPGRWDAWATWHDSGASLGLFIVEGLVLRDAHLGRRSTTEVLGAGDLMRAWSDADDASLNTLPVQLEFTVLEEARIAVLDRRFLQTVLRWPSVVEALFGRATRRNRWLSVRLVVNQLVRLEDRLMIAMWALGERWGRVTTEGVLIPFALTHSTLARLVGARRPSVTSAVGELAREGVLERTDDGWLLRGDPSQLVTPLLERLAATA